MMSMKQNRQWRFGSWVGSMLSVCCAFAFILLGLTTATAEAASASTTTANMMSGTEGVLLAVLGQEPQRRGRRGSDDDADEASEDGTEKSGADEDEAVEEEEEEDPDTYLALTNATVYAMTGAVHRNVTVLCKNGKIHEIGTGVQVPDTAEILDVDGYRVYPGLIAVRSSGILGGGDPSDSSDVYSMNLTLALAAGITTANTGNLAAKLTYGTLEDMVQKRNLFESLRYSSRNPQGKKSVRDGLRKVRDHLRDVASYEEEKRDNPDAEKPDEKWITGEYAKYMRLIKGEAAAEVDANTVHELIDLCDLSEEFGIELVIRGAYEGWAVAPRLARANVSAIVTPRDTVNANPRSNRPSGSTIENAAILYEHGIRLTFMPVGSWFGSGTGISMGGLAGRDLQHLPMEAAFGVRGGLSGEAAMRGLTIDAARIMGIDDRVGTIEVGKDADFFVCDGDPLHYMTQSRWTIVNGRIAYDKDKESLFEHIRKGGDVDAPPPTDHWPRRLGQPW
ncbi:MAG: amidohydrolase family protein [Planctomycetes bacterium]|nr:amidohydrolase family protein [Planctomycetota bacterium]